ncbi:SRPBCC domain-containing protein [Mariniflexile aquimaris]|uniref:SRPBCC domain-containing protein n=1 Tax=Mariniflexile aquimaris TaxID=881009 RepID=A0ABW3BX37_9FLAO
MNLEKITVQATINADSQKVWNFYTNPEHITKWNFADPSWHCPFAENNMNIGGKYLARMEAKDGSYGFDFEAVYTNIVHKQQFTYNFGERYATVKFNKTNNQTEVIIQFGPESENPIELQKNGWQAILNNFKIYTESN